MSETAIIQRLDRVERLLKTLVREKKKSTWIKAGTVMLITGWNKEKLRQMRVHGVINWKNDNGFFYKLESIPSIFIRHENKTTIGGDQLDAPGAESDKTIAP